MWTVCLFFLLVFSFLFFLLLPLVFFSALVFSLWVVHLCFMLSSWSSLLFLLGFLYVVLSKAAEGKNKKVINLGFAKNKCFEKYTLPNFES